MDGWRKVLPVETKSGGFSIRVTKTNKGVVKATLSMSGVYVTPFTEFARCDIFEGEDDKQGSILIQFSPNGAFPVTNAFKGVRRVVLPLIECIPQKPLATLPCEGAASDLEQCLVVKLPIAEWAKQNTQLAQQKQRSEERQGMNGESPPKTRVSSDARLLDPTRYLRNKGINLAKLGGDFYQMDSERVDSQGVLAAINAKRNKEGLNRVTALDVDWP